MFFLSIAPGCEAWEAVVAFEGDILVSLNENKQQLSAIDALAAFDSHQFNTSDVSTNGFYMMTLDLAEATDYIANVTGTLYNAQAIEFWIEMYSQVSFSGATITHVASTDYQQATLQLGTGTTVSW